ncbi:MAG: DUF2066 domain-containing protein [Hyphomonadaceae bacterium]|nr:DUF2066 domain-containing protein [Hyphomonadaceae bacterium]
MKRIVRFLALVAVFCAHFASPASAQQSPPDVYTVAGVRVDQTASNAVQASAQALAQAQRIAFQRLALRLTSAADQPRVALLQPDDATLDRLVRGVDVEEQPRRSGTRYLGRFAVQFDPAGVRNLLQGAGFSVIETRAAPILVVPQLAVAGPPPAPGAPPVADPWRQAWEQGGYAREILPLAVAPSSVAGPADWATAQAAASEVGASGAIFAIARVAGATLVTDLVETAPGGVRVNRGQVSAPIQGGDAGVPDAFRRLADAVNAKLQADYKARAGALTASGRSKMSVSALYRDMAEWGRIKEGLGAAGSVIAEIRIEAIARDGALVSFSHADTADALAQSLRRFGLTLDPVTPQGPILRTAR